MKAAIYQSFIKYEKKHDNIINAEKHIIKAAQSKCDIIFLPEMSFTGFSMNIMLTGEKNYETVEAMKMIAEKNQIAIGFGWVNLVGEKAENHYTVVSPQKTILSDYVKLHPFSYGNENQYFISGKEIISFELKGKTISTFICYDLRFPEIFQAASKKSDVIVVAANWPQCRAEHWKTLLDARAIENQSWIIGVNCFGMQGDIAYSGNSRVVMPDGKLIGSIDDKENCLYFEIGDEAQTLRKNFPLKNDRRNDFYRNILF